MPDAELHDVFRAALERLGIRGGGVLGLAVSGGADSTALLHLASATAPHLGLRPRVLHVDHRLRPDSDETAARVAAAADALGLPCSVLPVEVARAPRQSPEAAARDARYEALDRAADDLGCRWVATAHTMDDQAETVLLRALRGTGPSGLAGIAPVRGRFIRPLLGVRRAELREWLMSNGIAWDEDPSNADPRFERNWLRHSVMPRIEERRPGTARALARLGDLVREDAAALDELASERFSRAARVRQGFLLLPGEALVPPRAVASRVVRRALGWAGGPADAFSVEQVLAAERRAVVSGGVEVWRVEEGLVFVPIHGAVPSPARLPVRGEAELAEWGARVRVGSGSVPEPWSWRCRLNLAAGDVLWMRSRCPGDRVPTERGTRKIQDVLVDAKVPRFARDRVPVLVSGERALAVVGLTTMPATAEDGVLVVDVDPLGESWWSRATSRATF